MMLQNCNHLEKVQPEPPLPKVRLHVSSENRTACDSRIEPRSSLRTQETEGKIGDVEKPENVVWQGRRGRTCSRPPAEGEED